MSVAVCTAITARYDTLKPHPDIPGVDWVAFTDEPGQRDDWDVRPVVAIPGEHPRLTAKAYKLLPHIYLPEYEHTIWLDGSFEVTSPAFVDEALRCVKGTGIAMWRHTHRECVFDEAWASVDQEKYLATPIAEQARYYASVGLPINWGVWCTGVMVRRTYEPNVIRLMDAWMDENRRWTYQDQISFSFALWRLGLPFPDPLPGRYSATDCPWFKMLDHNHERIVP